MAALNLTDYERALIDSALADPPHDYELCPQWAHEGQRRAWACENDFIVALAGVQGGKSALIPDWMLREIKRTAFIAEREGWPQATYLIAGPSLELLSAQVIPQIRQRWVSELQLGTLLEGGRPIFKFSEKGAMKIAGVKVPIVVRFAYLSDPDTIVSMTALAAACDEHGQTKCKQASYWNLQDRLSVARSLGPKYGVKAGREYHSTTPYEFGWFYDDVVKTAEKAGALFNWPTWSNPSQDKDKIFARQATMPAWRWSMQFEGVFTKPAGAIYDCFDRDTHVVQDFAIPAHWKVYTGNDFGEVNMAAVYVAVKPAGEVFEVKDEKTGKVVHRSPKAECGYVFDSYHAGGRHVQDHAAKMKQRAGRAIQRSFGGAPSEKVWRSDFTRAGMPIDRPLTGDLEVGIARVYRQLALKCLYFFKHGAAKVYEEVERYSREVGPDGEPTEKIADKNIWHRADALRYVGSSLWPEPVTPEKEPYKPRLVAV